MEKKTGENLAICIALGYAAILAMIGWSRLGLFDPKLLITLTYGVGTTMVFGSFYVFVKEPSNRISLISRLGYAIERNLATPKYQGPIVRSWARPC